MGLPEFCTNETILPAKKIISLMSGSFGFLNKKFTKICMSWQVINEQPSLVQDRSGLVWTTPIVNQAQSIVQYNLTRL